MRELGDQIMVLEGIGDDPLFKNATSLVFWGGAIAAGIGHFDKPKDARLRNRGLGAMGTSILVRMIFA